MKKILYLLSLLILPISPVFAQLVVSNNADDGPGSLRAAITAGNSTSAPYSITFTTAGPISLTAVLPDITQSCSMSGFTSLTPATATGGTTIRRSSASNFRIFKAVTAGTNLILQDLILQNGASNEITGLGIGGAGVLAELGSGGLTMSRCLVRNCSTGPAIDGGGVQLVSGSAIITDCQFSNNTASGISSDGGGFRTGTRAIPHASSVTLLRCTFSGNWAGAGGALSQHQGAITLSSCTVVGNNAPDGAGLYLSGGVATLDNSMFTSNSATDGGAVYQEGEGGVSTFNACTFGNNSARHGGGLYQNRGGLTLSNCTFSANSSTLAGNAYYATESRGVMDMVHCSFIGN